MNNIYYYLNGIFNCSWIQDILANDFKCGYAAATLVFLLIILLAIVLKVFAFFLFRKPKCSEVEVKTADGKLVISTRVISALIGRELADTGRFNDVKVVVRHSGKDYLINIKASYAEGETGLPELYSTLQPQLLDLLKSQFGIENIKELTFQIDRFTEKDEDADTGL